ncbi:MAG: alpha/beta fold hydrolase [Pseudonocardiaceae bacterium]|nr:alpha/beta fold hydrolase [Pseudonocardiaceae bacterium]
MTGVEQRDALVRLGDIDVAYRVAGRGPAVVLVHGLAEDRHTWAAQQHDLPHLRTYAYDLRGHGDTTLGAPSGHLAQLRDDLLSFLREVSGPAVCVGFSLGGTVVLSAAAESADLVTGAVVLGTSTVVGRAAAGFYADRIELVGSGGASALHDALRADTAAALANPMSDVDGVTERRVAAVEDGAGYANGAAAMAGLRTSPLTPALAAIRSPVRVIGAEHDTFCPRKAADIILGALEHADYQEITGAGHLMNVDDPRAVTDNLRVAVERML